MSAIASVPRSLLVAASTCALVAVTTLARAHDPPVCFDVRWRANTRDPRVPAAGGSDDQAVCMSNRGLAFLDPTTKTWRIACAKALGIPSTEAPDLFYAPDGRLLVATSSGLLSNADGGCTWTTVPEFAGDNTSALAQDSMNAAHFVLTTGGRVEKPDGVYESMDGGNRWTELSTIAHGEFYEDLLIAPSTPQRLYAAATAIDAPNSTLARFVARSDDGGTTWTRIDHELGPNEAGLRALAVNPSDPDTVLFLALASDRTLPDRLRLSTDAGETFSDVLSAAQITSASFEANGTIAWATALSGAGETGLWRSSDAARTFAPIAGPYYMGCAFERGGGLYACGRWNEDSAFGGIGWSGDGGATFQALMLFEEICDPVVCAPGSETATACADLWRDWQYEVHGCTGVYGDTPSNVANPSGAQSTCGCPDGTPTRAPDAGANAGDATADASLPGSPSSEGSLRMGRPRTSSDCGCHAPGRARVHGGGTVPWIVLLLLVARLRAARASSRDRGASWMSHPRPGRRCSVPNTRPRRWTARRTCGRHRMTP